MKHVFLKELLSDPRYLAIVESVRRETPKVPEYGPKQAQGHDDWVYYSGLREGYRLAAQQFGVRYDGRDDDSGQEA